MRATPERSTYPALGRSCPDRRFRIVVFPQPDGPTIATNSPSQISSDKGRRTSIAPKRCETPSRRRRLFLITPPDTWDMGQPDEDAIEKHTDRADHYHFCYQEVHSQSIARVHYSESQAVPTRNHLRRYYNQPGQSGGDSQRRNQLRHDGRQCDLP